MKSKQNIDVSKLSRLFMFSKVHKSIIYALVLIIGTSSSSSFATRFDPPSLTIGLESFNARTTGDIFNVDFLVAHVVNNGRKVVREVGEITDGTVASLQNTAIFTNNNTTGSAAAGSVIIPPGTNAETIIILNQNEGDSIAIQR